MDTECDRSIAFDASGLCNHCVRYDALRPIRLRTGSDGQLALEQLVERVRLRGRGREYDCLIGLSGGIDSSYVAYLVKQHGLRPLAVHVDNGWNSELAVRNVERVVKKLGIDLITHVLDWQEFSDLQRSFLFASTPDGEIPTDHAIVSVIWREAAKRGIKYFFSGMNFATEAIHVPNWVYGHYDWTYIQDVHRRFGKVRLRTFPRCNFLYLILYVNGLRGVRTASILNYISYDRNRIATLLHDELGWQEPSGKHHESIYTRFYQGYVLPKKFGIEKRFGHLSDLINSGQLSRDDALKRVAEPSYPADLQAQDQQYVCRKLLLDPSDFEHIMNAEIKSHRDYKNTAYQERFVRKAMNTARSLGIYPQ